MKKEILTKEHSISPKELSPSGQKILKAFLEKLNEEDLKIFNKHGVSVEFPEACICSGSIKG